MKRRTFVLTSGLAAGQFAAPPMEGAQQDKIPLVRQIRTAPEGSVLQDVVVESGSVYSLWRPSSGGAKKADRQWAVTQTTFDGQIVREQTLPRGMYSALGLHQDAIWVHGATYHNDVEEGHTSRILLLAGNRIEPVKSFDAGTTSRFRYAGSSTLAVIRENVIDLWRFDATGLVRLGASHTFSAQPGRYAELIEPGVAAFAAVDGSQLTTIDLASGVYRDATISLPEITTAQNYYAKRDNGRRGRPVVLSATGADATGLLYAVVLPSPRTAVKILKIDALGGAAGSLTIAFPPRQGPAMPPAPTRLIVNGPDLGVIYIDGSVDWFEA